MKAQYDARTVMALLELTAISTDPVVGAPTPDEGEIVVFYGGWTLKQLRRMYVGAAWLANQPWTDRYVKAVAPGYYRMRVPEGTADKTWEEQILMKPDDDWEPASVTIAATAALVHLIASGDNLVQNASWRCRNVTHMGNRIALVGGPLSHDDDDGYEGSIVMYGIHLSEFPDLGAEPTLRIAFSKKC